MKLFMEKKIHTPLSCSQPEDRLVLALELLGEMEEKCENFNRTLKPLKIVKKSMQIRKGLLKNLKLGNMCDKMQKWVIIWAHFAS